MSEKEKMTLYCPRCNSLLIEELIIDEANQIINFRCKACDNEHVNSAYHLQSGILLKGLYVSFN